MDKKVLNDKEEKEIVSDVKEALSLAKQKSGNILDREVDDVVLLNQEDIDNKVYNKSKSGRKALIISFVIIFAIFAFGLYFYLSNNPRTIFASSFEKCFKAYEESFDSSLNMASGVVISDKGKFDYSLNNYDGIYKASSLGISIYLDKGYIYYNTGNGYYKVNDYALPLTANSDAEVSFLKGFSKAFLKSILYQKISGNKLDIMINGESHKTYRTSLVINEKNRDEIFTSFGDYLKKDSSFVKVYGEVSSLSDKKVLSSISKFTSDLKKYFDGFNELTISFYTEGVNDVIKSELVLDDKVYSITKLDENKYKYDFNDKHGEITYNDEVISVSGDYKVTLSKSEASTFKKEILKDDAYSLKDSEREKIFIGLLPIYLHLNS